MGIQYGITYLPFAVAQHERTIERRAKEAGLGDVNVEWNRVAGGNVLNDALLAGQLDCAATGYPSFLILWSKTRGPRDQNELDRATAHPLERRIESRLLTPAAI